MVVVVFVAAAAGGGGGSSSGIDGNAVNTSIDDIVLSKRCI